MKDIYIVQGGFHDTFRTIFLEHLEMKKAETIKILEERIGSKLFGDAFFISDTQSNKSRNKQVRLYQSEKLLHSEASNQNNEKQPTEWKKIFADHISDKGLTYKELILFKSKNTV